MSALPRQPSFIDQLVFECKARDRGDAVASVACRFNSELALAELGLVRTIRTDLSDATLDRIQDAFERREDRDDHATRDEIASDDAGQPCRGEL